MTGPEFRTLDEVEYGKVDQVSPLIRRVIADNPSKFTYRGTGTYIVGRGDVVVIDPGPELDSHRDALVAAIDGERVRAVLVTHCHSDHSPLAAWLSEYAEAPTYSFGPHPRPTPDQLLAAEEDHDEPDDGDDREGDGSPGDVKIEESTDHDFHPTVRVVDGEVVVDGPGLTMSALHTPGHTSNHTCWSLGQESALFTGDHVMGWSTTVVSPPDGDMAEYMCSLARVAARDDATLWPTHGPPRPDGRRFVESLIAHREAREAAILAAVRAGHSRIRDIVTLLYADVRPDLHKPARRSVWAHLVKLVDEGSIVVEGSGPPRLADVYRPR